jgi:hypothetical protein
MQTQTRVVYESESIERCSLVFPSSLRILDFGRLFAVTCVVVSITSTTAHSNTLSGLERHLEW